MDNLKLDSSIVDNSVFGIPSLRQSGKPETRIMNIAVTLQHINVSVGTLLLRSANVKHFFTPWRCGHFLGPLTNQCPLRIKQFAVYPMSRTVYVGVPFF